MSVAMFVFVEVSALKSHTFGLTLGCVWFCSLGSRISGLQNPQNEGNGPNADPMRTQWQSNNNTSKIQREYNAKSNTIPMSPMRIQLGSDLTQIGPAGPDSDLTQISLARYQSDLTQIGFAPDSDLNARNYAIQMARANARGKRKCP
eukprot:10958376-Lingulodinium_polyedra.AAC.1